MIDRLEQLLHVACSLSLTKRLVCLLSDFVEELAARNIFHNKINVLRIIVGLEILHNVGMIEPVQDGDLFHDAVDILRQFVFIEDFNRNMEVFLELIRRHEYSTEGSNSENFGLIIDDIVLFELMHTLLLSTLVDRNLCALGLRCIL